MLSDEREKEIRHYVANAVDCGWQAEQELLAEIDRLRSALNLLLKLID